MILAIPTKAVADLPLSLFASTPSDAVVIDIGNYHPELRDGRIEAIEEGMLDSQWVAQQIGHPVIKAFNNILATSLGEKSAPKGTKGGLPSRSWAIRWKARQLSFASSTNLASIPWTAAISTILGVSNPERLLIAGISNSPPSVGHSLALIAVIGLSLIGSFASVLTDWLHQHPRVVAGINIGAGLTFVASGISAVVARHR